MRYSFFIVLVLAACARDIPNPDHTISTAAQNAPFPTLVPIDDVLARATDGSRIESATADLQARAARLRRKADALRGRTIIDGQDRLRQLNLR